MLVYTVFMLELISIHLYISFMDFMSFIFVFIHFADFGVKQTCPTPSQRQPHVPNANPNANGVRHILLNANLTPPLWNFLLFFPILALGRKS